jgi:hypothetical protein
MVAIGNGKAAGLDRIPGTIRLPIPWLKALLLLWLLAGPVRASAAVEISFHSRDFGSTYPHAFIALRGTLDATGERVEGDYGFTVRHLVGPSILVGPVGGQVISEGPVYVARGRRHFALILSDDEYRRVMRLVDRWRNLPQPSYDLRRRTCVTFVAEVAAILGLEIAVDGALLRRPRAFLDRVWLANRPIILARARPAAGLGPRPGAAAAHRR